MGEQGKPGMFASLGKSADQKMGSLRGEEWLAGLRKEEKASDALMKPFMVETKNPQRSTKFFGIVLKISSCIALLTLDDFNCCPIGKQMTEVVKVISEIDGHHKRAAGLNDFCKDAETRLEERYGTNAGVAAQTFSLLQAPTFGAR